jgi:hypothetical protein
MEPLATCESIVCVIVDVRVSEVIFTVASKRDEFAARIIAVGKKL